MTARVSGPLLGEREVRAVMAEIESALDDWTPATVVIDLTEIQTASSLFVELLRTLDDRLDRQTAIHLCGGPSGLSDLARLAGLHGRFDLTLPASAAA